MCNCVELWGIHVDLGLRENDRKFVMLDIRIYGGI